MKPYYEEPGITIYNGDCREILPHLPKVDLVLTDPPYGMDYQSARRTDKTQWKPKISNDERPFIWWLYDAFRITSDPGCLACFCDWKRQEIFRTAIETAGYEIKSHVVWDREAHGMGDLCGSFAPQHDIIWFGVRGSFSFPGDRPKSVIRSMRLSGEELIHPNEKPISLMSMLIRSLSADGSLLADPFMGSGSTIVSAKREGRSAIGIEIEEKYCEIAVRRIQEASMPLLESLPEQLGMEAL